MPAHRSNVKTADAVKQVIAALEEMGHPERAAKSEYYAPTSMKVLGVAVPELRDLIRTLKSDFSDWNEREWIGFCKALVATGIFECQGMAFELIARSKKILGSVRHEDLQALGKNLDNWGSVDGYGVGIYGVLWREGVVKDRDIRELLGSENPWDRTGDTARTLMVCKYVVDDRHDMVRKALSWALRELSKRDREAVFEFLERYRNRMAGRVVREVSHKLEFGTKN